MAMEKTNLEKQLDQLYTDKLKAGVVLELAGWTKISEEYIQNAIDFYENNGKTIWAAEVAKKAGLTERAIELYEQGGELADAAVTAREGGLFDRANALFNHAIDDYIKEGKIDEAVKVAKKAYFNQEKIIEIYTNAGMYLSAARYASRYRTNGKVNEEAQKLYAKAIEELESDGQFSKAASISKEAGFKERAIENYEKSEEFVKAAEIAKDLGLIGKAEMYYDKAIAKDREPEKDWRDAALLAERIGRFALAIEIWKEHEAYWPAARVAKEAGLKETAYELLQEASRRCEEKGDFEWAAKSAKEAGLTERANMLYKKAIEINEGKGNWSHAIWLAEEAQLKEKLLEICEKSPTKGIYEIARIANRIGLTEKAKAYKAIAELLDKHKRATNPPVFWSPP